MSWVGSPDMEHEVFVPVVAARLRDALADPARVARAIPGLQQDAGAEPGTGRLKVRFGGHSVTYRGTVRVGAGEDGAYVLAGDATEARGSGTVRLALTVRVREAEGGATVTFDGTATADGRVAELPQETVTAAAARLLSRFAENLGATPGEDDAPDEAPHDTPEDAPGQAADPGDLTTPAPHVSPVDEGDEGDEGDQGDEGDRGDDDAQQAQQPQEPQQSQDAQEDEGAPLDHAGSVDPVVPVEPVLPDTPEEPPAEAAHARRTMIGRSAEEVDHAPPRGRYAPVPAPQTIAPGSPLRWAAPAAAVALASAIVVTRALRRRR